ncbi:MAG: sugar ABC transporter ATP-binding protein [Sulfuricurvum sp. MLSB]|uniref:ABC transporter ATP-binding protein n=1 Tax=unclassified Sulfuricurvum TaxID=2632390 RepID=UPI00050882B8|nr:MULTISPECIES: ABC transporter ATP-binding protein [unclassified Sulfuricurvum]KFN39355.1 MAG: sugar ABC transporter ATP-binding protein [Sulfuricurvum sp. MLSB]
MSLSVLEVSNIAKAYRNYGSEWRRVLSWFGLRFKSVEEHWTLQNINFSISPGEAIGIVGQNGAGKSTLLKIITGTLKPSRGHVAVRGKIAAILELGMGFHPDLTGRQNAYHSAGLMGYTSAQIDAVIDEIEAFAEIGEYFDQPVRTYSSGMQMRVAFATVTAYRPEILIVDEALSVGDAYFQHKSFDRIRQFQTEGTTLLLVSHDRGAIQAICGRAILLEQGRVIKDGEPEEVMDFYNALIADKENSSVEQIKLDNGKVQTISGTGEAKIEDVGLYNIRGEQVEFIGVGETVELRVRVKVYQNIPELVLGYMIRDRLGQAVFGINTHHLDQVTRNAKKGDIIEFSFSFEANLGIGSFSVTVALHDQDTHIGTNYEWRDQALIFNIVNISKNTFTGLCWLEQKAKVSYVNR